MSLCDCIPYVPPHRAQSKAGGKFDSNSLFAAAEEVTAAVCDALAWIFGTSVMCMLE